MQGSDGRVRIVIEAVRPEINCGRFPVKRVPGELVTVEADIFADGHDTVAAAIVYRKSEDREWSEAAMEPLANDRWRGSFPVAELGRYRYTLTAWIDRFNSWRQGVLKKVDSGQDVSVDLSVGSRMLEEAIQRATSHDAKILLRWVELLESPDGAEEERLHLVLSPETASLMRAYPDRSLAFTYAREMEVVVERERAAFGAWYEMFPRSCSASPGRHGTFEDCQERLAYVASMGFDVLYLPPIHPIGITRRKGKNNAPSAAPGDPGTPWAIGLAPGGHKAIHPELGTVEDFRRLLSAAREHNIEIALDIAFQCSPDHPYVKEHPGWFCHRPDGTVQYAENPPKKYEDIYPFDFETSDWQELWEELKSIVVYWIEQGVRIFRVDNPHTKPFPFWEWLIDSVRKQYPDVIFLSEAFTRPKVMYALAKIGFSQSYTYFAWRNTKWELTQFMTELNGSELSEYYRPNLWPNTPDILTEYLQYGGRSAFATRLVLAATLGASYGIYGPAFELCENQAKAPGSEEYLNSEKYEIKNWQVDRSDSLKDLIARINRIRKENPALQRDRGLTFHHVDNENIICYSKQSEERSNMVIVVVNLDPHHVQSGWIDLSLEALDIGHQESYQVHDLISNARYLWYGARNYVELNPTTIPAQIFRVRKRVRREQDFDYYM